MLSFMGMQVQVCKNKLKKKGELNKAAAVPEHTPAIVRMSKFIIASQSLMNSAPCMGLVKKSAIIESEGTYLISISWLPIRSFTKKYLMETWLVRPLVDRPFSARTIVDWLS